MGRRKGLWIAGFFLVAFVAILIVLGCLVVLKQNRDFESLEARIHESGGRIVQEPIGDETLYKFRRWFGSDIVNATVGFDGYSISVADPNATKEQLAGLLVATPLRSIHAKGARNLDDSWFKKIQGPETIRKLNLSDTPVTDQCLDSILKMKNLEEVDLSRTAISDKAVERLRALPRLRSVMIAGPNVKAIQLLELTFVNAQGKPTTNAEETTQAVGRLRIEGLTGSPRYAAVSVTEQTGESEDASLARGARIADSDLGPLQEDSPGVWSFRIDVSNVPSGKSFVSFFVFYKTPYLPAVEREDRGMSVIYHLPSEPIDLKSSIVEEELILPQAR
jgi:hypothetical protein